MRMLYTAMIVSGFAICAAPALADNPPAASSPRTKQAPTKITRRVEAMERYLDQQERVLEARLKEAGEIRSRGLTRNDEQLLRRAAQLERAAIQDYQKHVQQFIQFGEKLGESTKSAAEAAVRQHNGARDDDQKKQPRRSPRRAPRRRSR